MPRFGKRDYAEGDRRVLARSIEIVKRMTRYFAYGSNLCREQMGRLCPDHIEIGLGCLKNFKFIITSRGWANIVPDQNQDVYGVVYEISATDERNLDRFEEVPVDYQKVMLPVICPGGTVGCLVYVELTDEGTFLAEEGVASEEYADRVHRGVIDSCLPKQYADVLRSYLRRVSLPR